MEAFLKIQHVPQGIVKVDSTIKEAVKMYEQQNPGKHISLKKIVTLGNGAQVQIPSYLSPSAIFKAYSDPDEYFLQYCCMQPPKRFQQTPQMMYGSAFDGYVKSFLVERLYDKVPPEFELERIIKDQCEPQFWDKEHIDYDPNYDAHYWGKYLFEAYKKSGALLELLRELMDASELPRFEFTVTDEVKQLEEESGVVLLGKPDVYFKTKTNNKVIYDWKCNGINSRSPMSPKKQYMRVRDGWDHTIAPASRGVSRHRDTMPMYVNDMLINKSCCFSEIDRQWAAQVSTYGWLLGEEVGSDFIVGIDQLVGKPFQHGAPLIRVASHRSQVSQQFQKEFFKQAKDLWDKLQVGHVFIHKTKEESDELVAEMSSIFDGTAVKGSKEEWLETVIRTPKYGQNTI